MFYIRHGSDNFTMIDCMLPTDETWRASIVDELIAESVGKTIRRLISTHPDQDHVRGIEYLDSRLDVLNFYCVKNEATKDDPSPDFEYYCQLRDGPKAFYIYKGCTRLWMNQGNEERGQAGIDILWPDTSNEDFRLELAMAALGLSPNNTSAIIKYSLQDGMTALWMGDLETEFMEKIDGEVDLPDVDVLFAPHHGRESGRVPNNWLNQMDPTVIVLGEAPSEFLWYYPGWNTISQNLAGDITFDCVTGRVDVYVSSHTYQVDFLYNAYVNSPLGRYIGSFNT